MGEDLCVGNLVSPGDVKDLLKAVHISLFDFKEL